MSGTNGLNVTGPVLAYAKYPAGTDSGLFIYEGLDHDNIGSNANLRKVWVLELQQAYNPSNLPCGVAVVLISMSCLNISRAKARSSAEAVGSAF